MSIREQLSLGFALIDYASRGWNNDEYTNWRLVNDLLENGTPAVPFALDTGAANAAVMTYSPAITSYTLGLRLSWRAVAANTGSATVNVNGLGVKTLKYNNANLASGHIPIGSFVDMIYDGTNFIVIKPLPAVSTVPANNTVTPAMLTTGHPSWDGSGNLTATGNATIDGVVQGSNLKAGTKYALRHAGSQTSASVTFSTADPSGGSDGDIWFKYV